LSGSTVNDRLGAPALWAMSWQEMRREQLTLSRSARARIM
jgi:hypothetical protein